MESCWHSCDSNLLPWLSAIDDSIKNHFDLVNRIRKFRHRLLRWLVSQKFAHGAGQARSVVGLHQSAGGEVGDLRNAADVAGDPWRAAGGGFEQDIGQTFRTTRQ